MITLYTEGCANCGKDKKEITQLQRFCWQNDITLKIEGSKYNAQTRSKHLEALGNIKMNKDTYTSVVVSDNGYSETLHKLDYSRL